MRSLFARLLLAQVLSLSLVLAVMAAFAYVSLMKFRTGDFDVQMAYFARGLAQLAGPYADAPVRLEKTAREIEQIYVESAIDFYGAPGQYQPTYRIKRADGTTLLQRPAAGPVPFGENRLGFSEDSVGGVGWRTYATTNDDGTIVVQVAESLAMRSALARHSIGGALLLLAPSLLLLAAAAWLAARWAWRPLNAIAADVRARTPDTLAPLRPGERLRELEPLIDAVNALLQRIGAFVERERAFVDDAAHQLRTPLAVLDAQASVLVNAASDGERRAAAIALQGGVRRGSALIAQLLSLARADSASSEGRARQFDVGALLQERLAQAGSAALHRRIDLGLDVRAPCVATGNPSEISVAIDNVLDNALRHAPDGGRVEVSATTAGGAAVIAVADDGRGLDPALRPHACERFWRAPDAAGEGTGLGLAIAQRLLALHGGTVVLRDGLTRPGGVGLCVELRWPARPAIGEARHARAGG
jgi:two-component system OmpR family sensor kinase